MKRALSSLLALGAIGHGLGCDSRAGEDYQGESLMTISGRVVVNNDLAPSELVPALAFLHGDQERALLRIQDVSVQGEFPTSFTLDVFEPPPAEVMLHGTLDNGLQWPRMAIGYVAAVSPDHPEIVEVPRTGAEISCRPLVEGQSDLGAICESTRRSCVADGTECYTVTTRCELDAAGEEKPATCQVIEETGDPDLGRRLWKNFAGVSTRYLVIYLAEEAGSDSVPAYYYNDRRPVAAGYHLIEQMEYTPDELAWHAACREQANGDAYAEYNLRHGTSYAGPEDVPAEIHDEVDTEAEAIEDRLELERGCRAGDTHFRLVPSTATSDLTLAIGPDVDPPGL